MGVPDLPQAWRVGFDEVAELYDRVRPGYPDDLFDELAAALPRSPVVVEVGPGTGQATKGLVARGARVTAVELGAHLGACRCRKSIACGSLTRQRVERGGADRFGTIE